MRRMMCSSALVLSVLMLSACNLNQTPVPTPGDNLPPSADKFQVGGRAYVTPSHILPNASITVKSLDGTVVGHGISDEYGYYDEISVSGQSSEIFVISVEGSTEGVPVRLKRVIGSEDFMDALDINLVSSVAAEEYSKGNKSIDAAFEAASDHLNIEIAASELRADSYFVDISDIDASYLTSVSLDARLANLLYQSLTEDAHPVLRAQWSASKNQRKLLKSAALIGLPLVAEAIGIDPLLAPLTPYIDEYLNGLLNIADPKVTLDHISSQIAQLRVDSDRSRAGERLNSNLSKLRDHEAIASELLAIDLEAARDAKSNAKSPAQAKFDADYKALSNFYSKMRLMYATDLGHYSTRLLAYQEALLPLGDAARDRSIEGADGIIEAYLAKRIFDNGNKYFNIQLKDYYTTAEALKSRFLLIDDVDSIESTSLFRSKLTQQAYLISRISNLMLKYAAYTEKKGALYEMSTPSQRARLDSMKALFVPLSEAKVREYHSNLEIGFQNSLRLYEEGFSYFVDLPFTVKIGDEGSPQKLTFTHYYPTIVRETQTGTERVGYVNDFNSLTRLAERTFPVIVIDRDKGSAAVWACRRARHVPVGTDFYSENDRTTFVETLTGIDGDNYITAKTIYAIQSGSAEKWKRPDNRIISSISMDASYEINPMVSTDLLSQVCDYTIQSDKDLIKIAIPLSNYSKYQGSFLEYGRKNKQGVLTLEYKIQQNNSAPVIEAQLTTADRQDDYAFNTREVTGHSLYFNKPYNVMLPTYLPDYRYAPFVK